MSSHTEGYLKHCPKVGCVWEVWSPQLATAKAILAEHLAEDHSNDPRMTDEQFDKALGLICKHARLKSDAEWRASDYAGCERETDELYRLAYLHQRAIQRIARILKAAR